MRLSQCSLTMLAALTLACFSGDAVADYIVVDRSPGAVGGTITSDYWTNETNDQNFGDEVTLVDTTLIIGMDIYMAVDFGAVGDTATVRVWDDGGGLPGTLIHEFAELVSIVDTDGAVDGNHRVHVDFTAPITFLGGTSYWIGMSGTSTTFTQTAVTGSSIGPGNNFQFNGTTPQFFTSIGHSTFRLYSVPEPASLAMTLAGAGLVGSLGLATRRRRLG